MSLGASMNKYNPPKPEIFDLDEQYSTTRCVTRTQPRLINKPKDKIQSILFLPDNPERKAEGGLRTQGYFKQSFVEMPLISVITVVFNGAENLEKTINGVLGQSYDNVEYIIIDGGSTDGTLDIIRKYEGQIDYWVSEKDEGIYDAMNKGVAVAFGHWLNYMNVEDVFFDKFILDNVFSNNSLNNVDFIYSDTLLDEKYILNCDIKKNIIIHQSLIYKAEIHKEIGWYLVCKDLLISDYIFFMLCKNKNWYKTDHIISIYSTNGVSNKMFLLHLKQRIGVDLIFSNINRVKASLLLLIYPSYRFFKKHIKKI